MFDIFTTNNEVMKEDARRLHKVFLERISPFLLKISGDIFKINDKKIRDKYLSTLSKLSEHADNLDINVWIKELAIQSGYNEERSQFHIALFLTKL
jgi:hypothetical protein